MKLKFKRLYINGHFKRLEAVTITTASMLTHPEIKSRLTTTSCQTRQKYQTSIRTLIERAVAPVEPSAILNSGTSPVRLALNVTMMEKSPLKPPDNGK